MMTRERYLDGTPDVNHPRTSLCCDGGLTRGIHLDGPSSRYTYGSPKSIKHSIRCSLTLIVIQNNRIWRHRIVRVAVAFRMIMRRHAERINVAACSPEFRRTNREVIARVHCYYVAKKEPRPLVDVKYYEINACRNISFLILRVKH